MLKRCSRCGESKPEADFAWRRKNKNQRDSYCRPCRAAYKKEHYAKNKKRYIKQAKAHNDREIPKRIEWIVQYLEDHPCVDCGETDPLVLEFDHVRGKHFEVADGVRPNLGCSCERDSQMRGRVRKLPSKTNRSAVWLPTSHYSLSYRRNPRRCLSVARLCECLKSMDDFAWQRASDDAMSFAGHAEGIISDSTT